MAPVDLEARYANALKWIRTIAGMHYFGQAFDPEHMRALANVAADALNPRGRDLPDHDEVLGDAQEQARQRADKLSRLVADD